jgi:hypothetical protein
MINISMTQEQFDAAKQAVITNSEVTAHSETGAYQGTFVTSQVSMSYNYNFNDDVLELMVLAKYGIAELASESKIKQHLEALLQGV